MGIMGVRMGYDCDAFILTKIIVILWHRVPLVVSRSSGCMCVYARMGVGGGVCARAGGWADHYMRNGMASVRVHFLSMQVQMLCVYSMYLFPLMCRIFCRVSCASRRYLVLN